VVINQPKSGSKTARKEHWSLMILHYQKIIVALAETDRIMKEVNKIDFIVE